MSGRRASLGLLVAALATLAVPARASTHPNEPALDQSTPRRALRSFLNLARKGRDGAAAKVISLYEIPEQDRATEGPRLARELQVVIDHALWIEWEKISDKPEGDPATPGTIVLGAIPAGGDRLPIVLVRAPDENGRPVWLFSEATVERIPALWDAHGAGWIGERVPPVLLRTRFLDAAAWQWIGLAVGLGVAYAIGRLLGFLLVRSACWGLARGGAREPERLAASAQGPVRWAITAATFGWLASQLALPAPVQNRVDQLWSCVFIVALAWLAVRLVEASAASLEARLTATLTDESRRRGVRTQVRMLRRVLATGSILLGLALVLTRFEAVRHLGVSLLASAGLAGIVVGIAAQRSLGAILGGLQLSIAQPIRIDDTVVVGANEWGWVEEIHLTFVVVKLRTGRRLVVPVQKLLEEPFQNWTRGTGEVEGTFELPIARDVPIEAVRAELLRLCGASPLWDKRVARLQVVALAPDRTTLEAMVSSTNAAANWDLRCELREQLLGFVRTLEKQPKAA